MSGFRRGPEDDEDLVVVARRRPLADAERREIDAALDADPTLRIAHDVGRAFDDVAIVRPGDEGLIARVVDRTLASRKRRAVAGRWRIAVAVAAGFLLVAGVAGAYRVGVRARARQTPAAGGHHVAPPAPRTRTTARAGDATEAPLAAPVAPQAAPLTADRALQAVASDGPASGSDPLPVRAPRTQVDGRSIARPTARPGVASPEPAEQPPTPTPAAASAGDVTAADLFRRAGAARRAGALATAAALYDDLQARFPAAEEARLSHVSLGKLLLAMGRPREAERHFAAYLAGGAGALAAEAAFGRAQCFERLGRAREEREVWLGLLRDFPDSVYAGAARRRVAALEDSP